MKPLALIAELSHRCPLRCVYCSNPMEMKTRADELSTGEWVDVFRQAAELGVLQVDFTGGEPLARADLTELTAAARSAHLYTNLITSGMGLGERRLDELVAAGLDHVQLSFQGAEPGPADDIAGVSVHQRKVEVARALRGRKVAFTMNVVVHRENLDAFDAILELAEELAPDRLEIANVQYYGWAFANRERLLPTRAQLERTAAMVEAARSRLKGRMRIDFVVPDYYGRQPKACMGGWGRKLMLIDPAGEVLPCHAARVIPGMQFESVRQKPLAWIWEESASFQRFRGEEWMPEPCRSCDRRTVDFGGCRCQALLLTGDATATDPVCELAPAHALVEAAVAQANRGNGVPSQQAWTYRENPA
jgi:pyrroloquinoline quinone biosynthesis protein E